MPALRDGSFFIGQKGAFSVPVYRRAGPGIRLKQPVERGKALETAGVGDVRHLLVRFYQAFLRLPEAYTGKVIVKALAGLFL
jgi:hypothetical protein